MLVTQSNTFWRVKYYRKHEKYMKPRIQLLSIHIVNEHRGPFKPCVLYKNCTIKGLNSEKKYTHKVFIKRPNVILHSLKKTLDTLNCCWLETASTVWRKLIVFWSANRGFLGKWIEVLYISISKVRAGKKTKWGLGGRIKRKRGPRAKCCCWSDKFAEEADSHWNLANIKPLLLAEDIYESKRTIHFSQAVPRNLLAAQTVVRTFLFVLLQLTSAIAA